MKKIIYILIGFVIFCISVIVKNGILQSFFMSVIAIVFSFGISILLDKRKNDSINKSYEMDLPDLMIHIAMFAEAGLGIKDALERAVATGDSSRPLYCDLIKVFDMERKIGSKDFSFLLEELAQKRKIAALSNFTTVIIQNVRKGNDEISELFTAQAQLYSNERRRLAGKMADEAATLLLIPSTIVLIALIILLLAPAIMAFWQEM